MTTIKDAAYWAKLHVESDKRPAITLPTQRKVPVLGDGTTRARGGWREERRP
jgi:hypothetical protein